MLLHRGKRAKEQAGLPSLFPICESCYGFVVEADKFLRYDESNRKCNVKPPQEREEAS